MNKNIYKENHELKQLLKECYDAFNDIRLPLICIGGGLNDNVKNYTKEQMLDLHKINEIAKYTISNIKNKLNEIED